MSGSIEKLSKAGWTRRLEKTNEIIEGLNPLLNIQVKYGGARSGPKVHYSENGVTISIPDHRAEIESLKARVYALENP